MGESLDIITKIDTDERFGTPNQILPASGRKDIKAWQKSVQTLLRTLQRPRYVATGLLPEFQQIDGRHAFIKNHQLPPYEKPEWKGDGTDENPGMDMDTKLKLYAEAMAADPAPLIEDLNARLVELDDMVYSEHYISEGGFSLDDIDLWARLRSITVISGVAWPTKLRTYMDNLSRWGMFLCMMRWLCKDAGVDEYTYFGVHEMAVFCKVIADYFIGGSWYREMIELGVAGQFDTVYDYGQVLENKAS